MLGNDFLHALPSCHNLIESINFVMDLRKETLESSYITINDTSFSLNNLAILLVQLANTEAQSIAEQFYTQNFPNLTLNNSLIDPMHPDRGIDMKKYRELYYKKAGIDHYNKKQVMDFCKQYIQGLEWVHYYYHNWPKNWQWFFPYHYSPLAVDLVEYLTNSSSGSRLSRVSNKELPPILPFQQLLCVVPPKSKKLLLPYLQPVYKKLEKYYADSFEIDLEGKVREWEAIALLPFIKLTDIITAYEHAEKCAKYNNMNTNYSRNIHGKSIKFCYSQRRYTYKSTYGNIEHCCVDFTEF
jgi:5'-3' exonuclease